MMVALFILLLALKVGGALVIPWWVVCMPMTIPLGCILFYLLYGSLIMISGQRRL